MSELTLVDLGLTSEQTSTLPAEHAQMLAATLDAAFEPTLALPLLWHWAYFNPVVGTAGLGSDGHPRRENPLLVDFPRRMWVGGEVRSDGPLRTDVAAVRRTRLLSHARKQGSTGELLVVTLEHSIEQGDRAVVVERQDVIYRQAGSAQHGAALPIFRGDVQQPPNPLRPRLRYRHRGVPGPRRARPAHRDAARRISVTPPRQAPAVLRLPGLGPAVRRSIFPHRWRRWRQPGRRDGNDDRHQD